MIRYLLNCKLAKIIYQITNHFPRLQQNLRIIAARVRKARQEKVSPHLLDEQESKIYQKLTKK